MNNFEDRFKDLISMGFFDLSDRSQKILLRHFYAVAQSDVLCKITNKPLDEAELLEHTHLTLQEDYDTL